MENFLNIKAGRGDKIMIKEAIHTLMDGKDLSYEVAKAVMHEMMDGIATQAQMGAFLAALRMQGESIDEITAFAEVMRGYEALSDKEREAVIYFLKQAPLQLILDVNGKMFCLVHGAPCYENQEDYDPAKHLGHSWRDVFVWTRIGADETFEGPHVIIGHTPTAAYQPDKPCRIWHGKNVSDIDCGCAIIT